MITSDRIKIQFVRSEQKISKQPNGHFKEVRDVASYPGEGVRVDYFDGSVEWFPLNAMVYVVR